MQCGCRATEPSEASGAAAASGSPEMWTLPRRALQHIFLVPERNPASLRPPPAPGCFPSPRICLRGQSLRMESFATYPSVSGFSHSAFKILPRGGPCGQCQPLTGTPRVVPSSVAAGWPQPCEGQPGSVSHVWPPTARRPPFTHVSPSFSRVDSRLLEPSRPLSLLVLPYDSRVLLRYSREGRGPQGSPSEAARPVPCKPSPL